MKHLSLCRRQDWTRHYLHAPSIDCKFCFQGGRPRVSTEEEGVREMLGKPRGRAGKSKQDPDRGAQTVKRHLQTQG